LEIQTKLNGLQSKVKVVRAAVSDAGGVMEMLSSWLFSYGYFKVARGRSRRELTPVDAVTVDDMVEKFGVPTHIKVDVEGHELAVLHGARETLRRHSPVLFLELHNEMVASDERNPGDILDELAHLGYTTFDLDGKPVNPGTVLEKPICRIVAMSALC
jgi:FkbM family methyltransferase